MKIIRVGLINLLSEMTEKKKGGCVVFGVSLPQEVYEAVEKARNQVPRSRFIARALKVYLAKEGPVRS